MILVSLLPGNYLNINSALHAKNLLANNTCDNCSQMVRVMTGAPTPFCFFKQKRPEEDTCEFFCGFSPIEISLREYIFKH